MDIHKREAPALFAFFIVAVAPVPALAVVILIIPVALTALSNGACSP
jgi:hypothetical protein